jgi:hypothetical protein
MWPKIQDNEDDIRKLLIELNQNLSTGLQDAGGTTINVGDRGENAEDPVYFSTGGSGLRLDSEEWAEIPLGFPAQTVSFRFNDNIQVAFLNPNTRTSRIIPLFVDTDSPTTIGTSDDGVTANKIWIRPAPEQVLETDPVVHILAKR